MEHLLDDPEYLKSHDGGDMLSVLTRFPSSARKAIRDAEKLELGGIQKKKIKMTQVEAPDLILHPNN